MPGRDSRSTSQLEKWSDTLRALVPRILDFWIRRRPPSGRLVGAGILVVVSSAVTLLPKWAYLIPLVRAVLSYAAPEQAGAIVGLLEDLGGVSWSVPVVGGVLGFGLLVLGLRFYDRESVRERDRQREPERERGTSDPEPLPRIDRAAQVQGDAAIERYLELAEARHSQLDLAGFKSRVSVPIALEDLHVPLHALANLQVVGGEDYGDAEDAEARLRGHAEELALVDAFRFAAKLGRKGLVILGDPGSGKTTHLKRLLLACLRGGPSQLGLPPDTLPVYLALRGLEALDRSFAGFIESELESAVVSIPGGLGRQLLERGRLLFLLDGLDEVPDAGERAQVARWIEQASVDRPDCTFVVTSRFAGYRGIDSLRSRFLELHVRPLTPEQSERFVENWHHVFSQAIGEPESAARERAQELIGRLRESDFRTARIASLIRNPLLLANLCIVYYYRRDLPRERARLYEECVDVLLQYWRKPEGAMQAMGLPDAAASRRVLQPAAYWLHQVPERRRASADELAPVIESALADVQWRDGDSREFLRRVRDRSGLLTGWGADSYGFMHLGFQEYLAASEIRRRSSEGQGEWLRELAAHYDSAWWQEVILLLLSQSNPSMFPRFMREVLRGDAFSADSELWSLIVDEVSEWSLEPFLEWIREPASRGKAIWRSQVEALRVVYARDRRLLEPLLAGLAEHPSVEIRAWVASIQTERGTEADLKIVRIEPGGVELVWIPAGSFLMGSPESEVARFDDEGPQHRVEVASFWIGRYAVTNEEYGRYLQANPGASEPDYWGDRRFNGPRQPVVGVSWHDAHAFAVWCGCRLPTEAEWEYACRAGTETPFSFGEQITPEQVNYDGNHPYPGGERGIYRQQTVPVGSLPANSFGLHEMHGNVLEWVEDAYHPSYAGAPTDGSVRCGDSNASRVLRGGSWGGDARYVRSAYRGSNAPDPRINFVGFRVARTLP